MFALNILSSLALLALLLNPILCAIASLLRQACNGMYLLAVGWSITLLYTVCFVQRVPDTMCRNVLNICGYFSRLLLSCKRTTTAIMYTVCNFTFGSSLLKAVTFEQLASGHSSTTANDYCVWLATMLFKACCQLIQPLLSMAFSGLLRLHVRRKSVPLTVKVSDSANVRCCICLGLDASVVCCSC